MYTFHLTIDVRPDGHEAYRAYKLAALELTRGAAGHRWSLLLHPQDHYADRYYQVSQFESEADLDVSAQDRRMLDLVKRAEPYRHMTRTPAFREVTDVLVDSGRNGSPAAGPAPRWTHVRYELAAADRARSWSEQLAAGSPTSSDASGRRILLHVAADPRVFYDVTASAVPAVVAAPSGDVVAVTQDYCTVLADLGGRDT